MTRRIRVTFLLATVIVIAPAVARGQDTAAIARIQREVQSAERARIAGDTAAWSRVSPAFVFLHSTGGVDDRASFLARRAAGAPGVRTVRTREAEPAVTRLDGDVFVHTRLLADSAPAGTRAGQSRVLDVYVRRAGEWHWLAHQTTEVRPRWVTVTPDSAALAEFAGEYAAANGQRRMFAQVGNALVQRSPMGDERALIPLSDVSFGYEGLSATVTFVRDRSGRIIAADESARVAFVRFNRVR